MKLYTNTEPLPCPCCGSCNLRESWTDGYHISCGECCLKMSDLFSKDECIRRWNRRS